MTHDPRDRVEILVDGKHYAWCRKAVSISEAAQHGDVTVRGTAEALSAAGVAHIGAMSHVPFDGHVVPVHVIVSPRSLAPRPSGSRVPEAERTRPTVPLAVRVTPGALARLDAAAERIGLSRSAYVERLASELPPAIVNG